jgi:transcriptional regulator with XRE-family HTH domain
VSTRGTPDAVTVAFGQRVRSLRLELGWPMRRAGELAGLNSSTLCKIEAGADTTLSAAGRIAGVFGMPLAVLLSPDSCSRCHGAPPRGYICGLCATAGPEAAS